MEFDFFAQFGLGDAPVKRVEEELVEPPMREEAEENVRPDQTSPIFLLPDEVLIKVFAFTSYQEVVQSLARVCLCFRRVAYDGSLCSEFDLSGNALVTNLAVATQAKRSKGFLHQMNLSYCNAFSAGGMEALTTHCRNLRVISLAWCFRIGDADLRMLAESCPHLEEVDVSVCPQVFDAGAISVVRCCARLRKLCVDDTSITNRTLVCVEEEGACMEEFSFAGCPSISAVRIVSLLRKQSVKLNYSRLSNSTEVDYVVEAYLMDLRNGGAATVERERTGDVDFVPEGS